jgi:AcrR family transcriptional regulator
MMQARAAAQNDVDGRTARRDRNRLAVLDAVLALFSEDNLFPTPEQVAHRSGVSLRSVYRYVDNTDELVRAAIERHLDTVLPLSEIENIGEGPLDARIAAFVRSRLRVYEAIAATARASRLRAPSNAVIRAQLDTGRRMLRAQLTRQFKPELTTMDAKQHRAVLAAADALTQLETIDLYRLHRGFSSAQTRSALEIALRSLFTGVRA